VNHLIPLQTPIGIIRSFLDKLKIIKENHEEVLVLTHIDADGLSAGAIIAKALYALGIAFIIKPINQIRKDILEEINEGYEPTHLIILDMGSSSLNLVEETFRTAIEITIIDHHIPKNERTEKTFLINPWMWGYNGSIDISTSGLALLTILPLLKKWKELYSTIPNAITGALGDSQDVGKNDELIGINKEIVEIGEKWGIIREEKDLKIYKRSSKPLYQALASIYLPQIPGLTGNEEAALKFLEELGIISEKKDITLDDLDIKQKNTLVDAIVSRLVFAYSDKYTVEEIKNKLLTTNYIFLNDVKGPTRNGREFAILLNACGKLGKAEIGLGVAIGDREDIYRKSLELYNSYQEIISKNLMKAVDVLEIRKNLYIVDARDWLSENLTSSISSLLSWSKKIKEKGIIVVIGSSTNNYAKISLRLTDDLKGKIDLDKVINEVTKDIKDASGGGHDVAAGAYVPREKIEEFLEKLSSKIASLNL